MRCGAYPEIETARLQLRQFTPGDLDPLARIYRDPEVMRFIRNGVRTRARTRSVLEAMMKRWRDYRIGEWAVMDKETEALIGSCGFVDIGDKSSAQIGYLLDRPYWGKGIATEAARACLRYGFEYLKFEMIEAGALKENLGSRRVIEKIGMQPKANSYFDGHGGVYYSLARTAYQPDDSPFMLITR